MPPSPDRQARAELHGRMIPAHQMAWDAYLRKHRYAPVPTTFLIHVMRCCTGLQSAIVLHVLFGTLGAKEDAAGAKPEWCQVSMAELARRYGASINGVGGAIKALVGAAIIDERKAGGRANAREKEYRIQMESWTASLKPLEAAAVEDEDPPEDGEGEDEAAAELPPGESCGEWRVKAGCASRSIRLPEPVQAAAVVNRTGLNLRVNAELVGGQLRIVVADGEQKGNYLPSAVGKSKLEVVDNTQAHQPTKQAYAQRLNDVLAPWAKRLGSPAPASKLAAAIDRLWAENVETSIFESVIEAKAKKFKSWGFLPHLVEDAIASHHQLAREERQPDGGTLPPQADPAYVEFLANSPEDQIVWGEFLVGEDIQLGRRGLPTDPLERCRHWLLEHGSAHRA